jgi:hypothetical protein
MSDRTYTINLRARWVHLVLVAAVTAAVVAPAAAWATHTFTDVPASHVFHEDIDWIKEAGVTIGCNPPSNTQYCPDDAVTRGQMSAFMRRLATNQVVDAGQLQGEGIGAFAHDLSWHEADVSVLVGQDLEGVGQVACPAGKHAISGGSLENSSSFVLTDTAPFADLSGWQVSYENTGTESNLLLTVYVLCASYSGSSSLSVAELTDPNAG